MGVKAIKEGLEMFILGALREACDSGSLGLVIILDEVFCNLHAGVSLFGGGMFSLPEVDSVVEFKNI